MERRTASLHYYNILFAPTFLFFTHFRDQNLKFLTPESVLRLFRVCSVLRRLTLPPLLSPQQPLVIVQQSQILISSGPVQWPRYLRTFHAVIIRLRLNSEKQRSS